MIGGRLRKSLHSPPLPTFPHQACDLRICRKPPGPVELATEPAREPSRSLGYRPAIGSLNLFTTFLWEPCVIRRREYPNPRKWIHPLDGPRGSPVNDYARSELAYPASILPGDIRTRRLRGCTPPEANPSLVVDPGGRDYITSTLRVLEVHPRSRSSPFTYQQFTNLQRVSKSQQNVRDYELGVELDHRRALIFSDEKIELSESSFWIPWPDDDHYSPSTRSRNRKPQGHLVDNWSWEYSHKTMDNIGETVCSSRTDSFPIVHVRNPVFMAKTHNLSSNTSSDVATCITTSTQRHSSGPRSSRCAGCTRSWGPIINCFRNSAPNGDYGSTTYTAPLQHWSEGFTPIVHRRQRCTSPGIRDLRVSADRLLPCKTLVGMLLWRGLGNAAVLLLPS